MYEVKTKIHGIKGVHKALYRTKAKAVANVKLINSEPHLATATFSKIY